MVWAILIVAAISKFIGIIGGNAATVGVIVSITRWILIIVAIWTVFYFHNQVTQLAL